MPARPIFFLIVLLWAAGLRAQDMSGPAFEQAEKFVVDENGAIVRGDVSRRQIALVFTGDEFGDGGMAIRRTLRAHRIHASFFLTGNFYSNPAFTTLIRTLKKDGHYLGPHSDKHLLYADWTKRDSLLVTQDDFTADLRENYRRMAGFGISLKDAPYFLPPYEWYNTHVADWTEQLGLHLVNYSPGTRSTADYTYPEMGDRYVSSGKAYQSILDYEKKDPHGLNGFILLIHIGTDPRRTDKLYDKLDTLLSDLQAKGYQFVTIRQMLGGG
jgi:peptidoglycan/xylan/chitin deacetylase (PgdA/CDA1 family)